MGIEIKHKTVNLVFQMKDGKLRGQTAKDDQVYTPKTQALKLYFSLMGETAPELAPLTADFSMDKSTQLYRYDWMVGATPFNGCYDWNWFEKIAEERAFIVQLLIDSAESGCATSEVNAFLLGLLPSKDTTSYWEALLPKLAGSLDKMADIVNLINFKAAAAMKITSVVSDFVTPAEKSQKPYKNWFLYRFLDEKRQCHAVEWNISRNVIHQYGSVLRGSILLAFHGNPKSGKPLKLLLRPRLNFSNTRMDYDPSEEELEKKDPVELEIKPVLLPVPRE
jgi:hypothetical protein